MDDRPGIGLLPGVVESSAVMTDSSSLVSCWRRLQALQKETETQRVKSCYPAGDDLRALVKRSVEITAAATCWKKSSGEKKRMLASPLLKSHVRRQHVNREKNRSVLVEVVMLVVLQHTGNTHSATQPLQTAHVNTVRPL